MQSLIQELLEYSRAGRGSGEMEDVDLNEVVNTVRANLHARLDEFSATIESESLPSMKGDSRQILQLIQNLVENALKFQKEDVPPVIRITVESRLRHWEFAVADNGIGIDPKYQDRVFVIFQRLHTRDQYEGNGLGLAICKKIVDRHSGSIWLDPDYKDGACFRFQLSKHL